MPSAPEDPGFLRTLRENEPRILRFASLYADQSADREELLHEIVFQLWKAYPSFRGASHVDTWLYRIALRVATRFKARTARRKRRSVHLEGIAIVDRRDTVHDAARNEEKQRLRACISRLGPADRALVTLHLEGLSNAAVADTLGITPGNVAVKLTRARKKLLSCLEETKR